MSISLCICRSGFTYHCHQQLAGRSGTGPDRTGQRGPIEGISVAGEQFVNEAPFTVSVAVDYE